MRHHALHTNVSIMWMQLQLLHQVNLLNVGVVGVLQSIIFVHLFLSKSVKAAFSTGIISSLSLK